MAREWPEAPFEEVIDFQEGPGILAKDFCNEGVPLVRLAGLDRGASLLAGCNYLDPNVVAKKWAHFALKKGDILLSTSASLGRIAVVGEEGTGAIAYTGIIRMRPRDSRLLAPFIRYLLEGPAFQRQAEMVGVGSVIRHFGPMHLRQMTVTVPPLPEQRAIAHILGTLDDKIELNRRMNETLEAMARAIFKDWFVDFGPVRAKVEGRPPYLAPDVWALFAERLDGEGTPEGWRTENLLDHASLVSGGTPKTEVHAYWNGPIWWASAKDVSQCGESFLAATERTITARGLQESATRMIPALSTVVVARGATTGRYCMLGADMAMNQTCYALVSTNGRPFWVNCAFGHVVQALVHAAHGSVFDTITTKTFQDARVLASDGELLDRFETAVRPLFQRVLHNIHENERLAATRDLLLPRLISGEIRVKAVEEAVA